MSLTYWCLQTGKVEFKTTLIKNTACQLKNCLFYLNFRTVDNGWVAISSSIKNIKFSRIVIEDLFIAIWYINPVPILST